MSSLALLSFLFGLTLVGCSKKADDTAEVKPRATVEVATVTLGDIDDMISATGAFEVLRDEKVKSTIAGRVEKVCVLEGDFVRKGELLAKIVSQESNAAIEGATALLSQATTPAEKKQAEEALKLAENTAAVASVTAPFSGAIINRFVTEGELVNQGSDLVEIIDPKSEYFIANVPINYLATIRPGELSVIAIPGANIPPLHGTVQAINPATNPNSQSVEVRISLSDIPSVVTAGTFGNVQIRIGKRKSVILVPKEAVYHNDELDKYFVWRIQGDSIALLTQVNVGLSDSTDFQIKSGLKPGDVVATVGGYGLPDSTSVTISGK